MATLSFFKKYAVTIPANGQITVYATGVYVACGAKTGSFEIAVDDSEFTDMDELTKADVPPGEEFQSVHLKDTSGAENAIEISIGRGGFDDNRTAIPDGVKLRGSPLAPTVPDVTLTAVTATKIADADSTRREILISNLVANGAVMRIGDANVGAARGTEISPGQTLALSTTAEIWGYSVPGEAVGVTEVKN